MSQLWRAEAYLNCSLTTPRLTPETAVEVASFSTGVIDFPHTLFIPMHYEPGYAYPLVVWLHGRESNERQLHRIMPLVSLRNFVAVAPRGLLLSDTLTGVESCGWNQSNEHVLHAEQRVFDCVALASRKLHIHRERVFLAGFHDGGTMALRIALAQPERFAGVCSFCSPLPRGQALLGNLSAARRLAVFLAAGHEDPCYPTAEICKDLQLLYAAGFSVTLRQYCPCGHELLPEMLADFNRWLIQQITSPPEIASSAGITEVSKREP